MRPKNVGLLLFALLLLCPARAAAQQRLLTIDDIYDPVKKLSFAVPTTERTWAADGEHYLEGVKRGDSKVLMRVNARAGEAAPPFDAARMEAALAKVEGVTPDEAKSLAREDPYKWNRAQR